MTLTDEEKEATFLKYGEIHYVWPHLFPGGNSAKCADCRYFSEDAKNRSLFAHIKTGECHSKASKMERGHLHSSKGWDRTNSNNGCHWWFPIEKQESEKTLLDLLPEENE